MKNLFLILSAAIFFTRLYSCNNETKVAEESKLISYDPEMLKQIESDYDSSFVENLDRSDYASISHYIVDSINENPVFRDSMQRVVAIVKRERGKNYFTAEYYPNGQLKRKFHIPPLLWLKVRLFTIMKTGLLVLKVNGRT